MKLSEADKQEVYKQIRDFNSTPSVPGVQNSRTNKDLYYYVDDSVAENSAKFFKHLIDNSEVTFERAISAIDLCFGSGNLTSHILLESGIDIETPVLNDKITDKTNQSIVKTKLAPSVTSNDITSDSFVVDKSPFNLIVFNPQMGGDEHGDLRVQLVDVADADQIVITPDPTDWLHTNYGIEESNISVDIINRTASITYDKAKPKIKEKCINYFEIILKKNDGSKSPEHLGAKLCQLRKNINKIAAKDHVIVFYGKKENFEFFFKDYKFVRQIASSQPVFIAKRGAEKQDWKCYRSEGATFVEAPCDQVADFSLDTSRSLREMSVELDGAYGELQKTFQANPHSLGGVVLSVSQVPQGKTDYEIKNLLLKGVPGTGKSRLIDQIIEKRLELDPHDASHVLRINIHSGSSNADLMQGIGLTTNANNQIEYKEKQGLIFDLLYRACLAPKQAFVLVLEEIQENSLNELIGDLIYLIEPEKRARISERTPTANFSSLEELMEIYISASEGKMKYVRIPNLVKTGTVYRKMFVPDNLYLFCTSNYRDDKKIIEDNLLRRFDVLDVFPKAELIKDAIVRAVFESLNKAILETLKYEVHPDRFEIGHALWMHADNNKTSLAKVLYKSIIELKEIREIQSSDLTNILIKLGRDLGGNDVITDLLSPLNDSELTSLIKSLQKEAYPDLLELTDPSDLAETAQPKESTGTEDGKLS